MNIGNGQYAVLSAVVFAIGLYGVFARRHPLAVVMALGLLFAAPLIALAGFISATAVNQRAPLGGALATMAIIAATCLCSIGFALVLLLWRRSGRADVDALGDIEE
ncbi:MAG TPA: NADH-quinone oxidoreductase subunit K [Candidatus Acidoferrales bacterium]|nr:NADH-quinone oxidoreductase subunit K [Candidatus Acidoferrales bacterium]